MDREARRLWQRGAQPFPPPASRRSAPGHAHAALLLADAWRGVQALPWLGGQKAAVLLGQLLMMPLEDLEAGMDGMAAGAAGTRRASPSSARRS